MKNLRIKMIFTVFFSVSLVFLLTLAIMQVSLVRHNIDQADGMTQIISIYNGVVPKIQEYEKSELGDIEDQVIFDEESAFRTRYFVVYFNDDMQVKKVDIDHIASIDEDTARDMAKSIVTKKKTVGYINKYRFRIVKNSEGKNFIIFLDCRENFASQRVTIIILAASLVLFTILITFIFAIFSKRIFKPFEENSRRQKQFITDASHELKTPLAIISANAEVLAYKDGGNEWLNNITEQISHMGSLINELLTLSKVEEIDEDIEVESVNFSDIVNETINNFGEVFKQKNVTMQVKIEPNIVLTGNKKQLDMLVSILVENASKYVTESGVLKVLLKKSGKYTILRIFNTAKLSNDMNIKYLFDRFYRPDNSRTSVTGGQGIGLSIAKKITNMHNGSISAKQVDGGICFTAEISNCIKKNGAENSILGNFIIKN